MSNRSSAKLETISDPSESTPVAPGQSPSEPAFSTRRGRNDETQPTPPATGTAATTDRRASTQSGSAPDGSENRNSVVDRRAGLDRRLVDIGSPTGLERRRGPGRRRSEDRRSAEEGEMSDEQFQFVLAIDTYKRLNGRPFPTWTEVLEVVKQLGYRKVAASTLNLPGNSSAGGATASTPRPPESDFLPG